MGCTLNKYVIKWSYVSPIRSSSAKLSPVVKMWTNIFYCMYRFLMVHTTYILNFTAKRQPEQMLHRSKRVTLIFTMYEFLSVNYMNSFHVVQKQDTIRFMQILLIKCEDAQRMTLNTNVPRMRWKDQMYTNTMHSHIWEEKNHEKFENLIKTLNVMKNSV